MGNTERLKKRIVQIANMDKGTKAFWVDSQPNDSTNYIYLVMKEYDTYRFVCACGNIKYPSIISKFATKCEDEYIAKREGVNIFTVRECLRTIEDIELLYEKGKLETEMNVVIFEYEDLKVSEEK